MVLQPKVLLICSDDAKSSVLEGILSDNADLRTTRTLAEFESCVSGYAYDAVFVCWTFHKNTWKDALTAVRRYQPDLPVIVFCHTDADHQRDEVLGAGGFWLLTAPYWQRTVLSVLNNAIVSRPAQRPQKPRPSPRPLSPS